MLEIVENGDLSFSSIVDYLQNDEAKAQLLIADIAIEQENVCKKIEDLRTELDRLHRARNILQQGALHTAKHLGKELPLFISRPNMIVKVNGEECDIIRNIL